MRNDNQLEYQAIEMKNEILLKTKNRLKQILSHVFPIRLGISQHDDDDDDDDDDGDDYDENDGNGINCKNSAKASPFPSTSLFSISNTSSKDEMKRLGSPSDSTELRKSTNEIHIEVQKKNENFGEIKRHYFDRQKKIIAKSFMIIKILTMIYSFVSFLLIAKTFFSSVKSLMLKIMDRNVLNDGSTLKVKKFNHFIILEPIIATAMMSAFSLICMYLHLFFFKSTIEISSDPLENILQKITWMLDKRARDDLLIKLKEFEDNLLVFNYTTSIMFAMIKSNGHYNPEDVIQELSHNVMNTTIHVSSTILDEYSKCVQLQVKRKNGEMITYKVLLPTHDDLNKFDKISIEPLT